MDRENRTSRVLVSNLSSPVMERRGRLPVYRRYSYGIGHVFNDLCASMWFTYMILFYHMVLRLSNAYAGLIVLIGQTADALATPVVGYLCDRTENRYGGRKSWHLAGTIMVASSLFFFWHHCIYCSNQPLGYLVLYYSCFIIVFQVGWATVQISHLALIPELTDNETERVGLNSIRYGFTILSNASVYGVMILLLAVVNHSHNNGNDINGQITPSDEWIFSGMALGIIVVGLTFSLVFHLGTKEPRKTQQDRTGVHHRKLAMYKWFLKPKFYLVAIVYMCTRLVVNISQAYITLYFIDSLQMYRISVAIAPLVIFLFGFFAALVSKKFNRLIGRYPVYIMGLLFVWSALVWFRLWPSRSEADKIFASSEVTVNFVFTASALLGVGSSTLLITSLCMVADLIGTKTSSSAFVYGTMSFTDKLSNGVAIQIIQLLHPCKGSNKNVCCPACSGYYRSVLAYVPGGASVLACAAILLLLLMAAISKNRRGDREPFTIQRHDNTDNSSSSDNSSTSSSDDGDEQTALLNKRSPPPPYY